MSVGECGVWVSGVWLCVMCVGVCGVWGCVGVCVWGGVGVFFNYHLLHCMLHYNAVTLHTFMLTYTYCLLLSTDSIYRLVPYLPCFDYTQYCVQLYVACEFCKVFVEFYTKFVSSHWPFF